VCYTNALTYLLIYLVTDIVQCICTCSSFQGFALSLVSNMLNGEMLQVTIGQSVADRGLAEAVIHFSIVMQALRDHRLLQPLQSLITDAGSMAVRMKLYCTVAIFWLNSQLI